MFYLFRSDPHIEFRNSCQILQWIPIIYAAHFVVLGMQWTCIYLNSATLWNSICMVWSFVECKIYIVTTNQSLLDNQWEPESTGQLFCADTELCNSKHPRVHRPSNSTPSVLETSIQHVDHWTGLHFQLRSITDITQPSSCMVLVSQSQRTRHDLTPLISTYWNSSNKTAVRFHLLFICSLIHVNSQYQ